MGGTQGGSQAQGVRDKYRQLEADMDGEEHELTRTDNTKLKDKVEEANELFRTSRESNETHETARNSAIDSRCILRASKLGAVQSRNLNQDTPMQFARAVKRAKGKYEQRDEEVNEMTTHQADKLDCTLNWDDLAKLATETFAIVPSWDCPWEASLLAVPDKERKARERKQKDAVEKEVRPEELTTEQVNSGTEATQKWRSKLMITHLEEAIAQSVQAKHGDKVNFFHLVMCAEPEIGFGQTIENMFDFSFHMKEGNVSIEMNKFTGTATEALPWSSGDDQVADTCRSQVKGEPMVRYRNPPSAAEYKAGVSKVQNILKLDFPTWEDLATRYGAQSILSVRRPGLNASVREAPAGGSSPVAKRAKK